MQRTIDDLNSNDLRRLFVERRKFERRKRLKDFQRNGRVTLINHARDGYSNPFTQVTHEELSNEIYLPRQKPWVSKVLLVVELLAVIGLLGILYSGVHLVRTLNQEVQAAMSRSVTTPLAVGQTATPTPLATSNPITAVVLPSGHTSPDESGRSEINLGELPEDQRDLATYSKPTVVPPAAIPGIDPATHIVIEKIEVDAPILPGDSWEELKQGVGQHPGTANPGTIGNMVLSGHNDIFGEVFRHLDQLEPGDKIHVFSGDKEFLYTVTESKVVPPTQVDVMYPTETATLTLVSCYPYLIDNKRIIITADFTPNS